MASLERKEDVEKSKKSTLENKSNKLKLEMGDNYIVILDKGYEDGYIHWVPTGVMNDNGHEVRRPITCNGGLEGGGYAPDDCIICKRVSQYYRNAKEHKNMGDEDTSEDEKMRGNQLRAKYSAVFKSALGTSVLVESDGKKKKEASFMDSEASVLSMTKTVFNKFITIPNDERYPEIDSASALVGKVLNFKKEQSQKKRYVEVSEIYPVGEIKKDELEMLTQQASNISLISDFQNIPNEKMEEILDAGNVGLGGSESNKDDEDFNDLDNIEKNIFE